MLCVLYLLSGLSVLFFMLAVFHPAFFGGTDENPKYWPVFMAVILCQIFASGTGPLTYELAAEISFPVGEETSATFLSVLMNFLYIVTMLGLGNSVSATVFNWVFLAVLLACSALMVFVRGQGSRSAADAAQPAQMK